MSKMSKNSNINIFKALLEQLPVGFFLRNKRHSIAKNMYLSFNKRMKTEFDRIVSQIAPDEKIENEKTQNSKIFKALLEQLPVGFFLRNKRHSIAKNMYLSFKKRLKTKFDRIVNRV
jgi:hypothetical protein